MTTNNDETREWGGMTPGPWELVSDSIYYHKDQKDHRRIATVAIYGLPDPQSQANARAIVALPDLIEHLRTIAGLSHGFPVGSVGNKANLRVAVNEAHQALKKAGVV